MTLDPKTVTKWLESAPRDLDLYNACRTYAWHFDGENIFDNYRNGEIKLLTSLLPGCRVVFDVGANEGNWIDTVLTINNELEVHAFEPSAPTFEILRAKTWPAGVHVSNVGLGDVTEERELFQVGSAVQSELRSLYRRDGLEEDFGLSMRDGSERVRIITLDDYCRTAGIEHIDYLKIDTEGHDLRVLRGAMSMIARHAVRYIQFEYGMVNIESRVLVKDFFELFKDYRYNLHKVHPDGYMHFPRYNARLEGFQYQNWLVARQE